MADHRWTARVALVSICAIGAPASAQQAAQTREIPGFTIHLVVATGTPLVVEAVRAIYPFRFEPRWGEHMSAFVAEGVPSVPGFVICTGPPGSWATLKVVNLRGAHGATALAHGGLEFTAIPLAPQPDLFICSRGGVESRILSFGCSEGFSGVYTVYSGEYSVDQPAATAD